MFVQVHFEKLYENPVICNANPNEGTLSRGDLQLSYKRSMTREGGSLWKGCLVKIQEHNSDLNIWLYTGNKCSDSSWTRMRLLVFVLLLPNVVRIWVIFFFFTQSGSVFWNVVNFDFIPLQYLRHERNWKLCCSQSNTCISVKFAAGIHFLLITLMLEKENQGKINKVIVLQESIPSSIYWTHLLPHIIYIYMTSQIGSFVFDTLHWEGPAPGAWGSKSSAYK